MPDKTQSRLLMLAALFLGIYCLALTLAPAARAHSWGADYRWGHWIGFGVWAVGFAIAHQQSKRYLSRRDPYLLPVVALISGWGLLTIWRLTPAPSAFPSAGSWQWLRASFGLRQTLWLALALAVFILGLRLPSDLRFLRRYKYLWLTNGLLLTSLTLIFGTNPLGYGPRLWLGCCSIYLQPSEPLKLLLVVYLAAYFADWQQTRLTSCTLQVENSRLKVASSSSHIPHHAPHVPAPPPPTSPAPPLRLLIPTFIMTGLALLLLLVQRDLGTASIFIFLYSVMVYLATGWRWVPLFSALGLELAGLAGYTIFDVVRLRVDAWLNPWLDPSGRSYQIVQSLLAVANGGILGRGPGLGSPSLVPVAHSDFIFAAIAEEMGLAGVIGLLALLGLLVHRGVRIAIQSPDPFRRYLSAGLTTFLVAQSMLIIGGNLRILPLTGVTLPFISYGGSSLLVSFVALLLLLHTSAESGVAIRKSQVASRSPLRAPRSTAPILPLTALLLASLAATSLIAGWWAYIRGPDLLARTDNPRRALADRYVRRGSLLGRRNTALAETTGQIGDLQRTVRYPDLGPVIGYTHPVYGQSGLEASLDSTLRGLQGHDPLTIGWNHLLYGFPSPGLDIRLTLDLELQRVADDLLAGHTGALILLNAQSGEILVMTSHPTFDPNQLDDLWNNLIEDPRSPLINRVTQGGYPTGILEGLPFLQSAAVPGVDPVNLRLPQGQAGFPGNSNPLQIAVAAASLSNGGIRPAPRLALAYRHPDQGWLVFPALDTPQEILNVDEANAAAYDLAHPELSIWQTTAIPAGESLTWYLAGTLPGNDGIPLTLALVLEESNLPLAEEIGQAVLLQAFGVK